MIKPDSVADQSNWPYRARATL